jgi:hypothetical protein
MVLKQEILRHYFISFQTEWERNEKERSYSVLTDSPTKHKVSITKITAFRDVTLCSLTIQRKLLSPSLGRREHSVSSILKMETADSTETSVPFYQISSCHTPDDSNLHIHSCENLKSHFYCVFEAMIQLTPWVMAYTQK